MSHEASHTDLTADALIIEQWQAELASLPEESLERAELAQTIGEFSVQAAATESNTAELGAPPAGFESWRVVPEPAEIHASEFKGRIYALKDGQEVLRPTILELVTDRGNKIRVADLRPEMTSSLKKEGPKSKAETERLDNAFWHDMKLYADDGKMRRAVTNVSGVGYTRAGKTKLRAYWTNVNDKTNREKVRTVARIGDAGDDAGLEKRLYRKLFHMKVTL